MALACEKLINDFSPSCNEIFQCNKGLVFGYAILFNRDTRYEISEGKDTHTIFLNAHSCSCRGWNLSGIPSQ